MSEPAAGTPVVEVSDRRGQQVHLLVNSREVTLTQSDATGAEIKAAAIAAGVPIESDFVLSEVLASGRQRVVPDERKIHLKDGDEFWAIPGDDNS